VSRHWRLLSQDELIWRRMCFIWKFVDSDDLSSSTELFMFRRHFKMSYITKMNWERGGHLMRLHRLPIIQPDLGVVTSLAMDDDWVVVGLASCKVHVFSRRTGVLSRTLVGCKGGVWAVWLIGGGGIPQTRDEYGKDANVGDRPLSAKMGIIHGNSDGQSSRMETWPVSGSSRSSAASKWWL